LQLKKGYKMGILIKKITVITILQIFLLTSLLSVGYADNVSISQSTLSPRLLMPQEIIIKALDRDFKTDLSSISRNNPEKNDKTSWLQKTYVKFAALFNRHPLMTVSMEGYHEKYSSQAMNANSKGGLGAFFGCLIRGFKAIGLKTVAFQPDFSMRRRQKIRLKHDHVIEHVKSVFCNLNWCNFEQSAYPVVEQILQLSEQDALSLSAFEKRVIGDSYLNQDIYMNGESAEGKKDRGRGNIAYVYTAALSIMVKYATQDEKIDAAERAVKKVYKTINPAAANGEIIRKTVEIIHRISNEQKLTFEHFQDELSKEKDLKNFIKKYKIDDEQLYNSSINYLARMGVTKEQYIVNEQVSYENEPGEYIKDKHGNDFIVTIGGLDVDKPEDTRYYEVKFRRYFDGNVTRVQMVCPELYGLLYKADTSQEGKRQRFNEYMVSAWAMYAFLKHFPDYKPGMIHFNESPFILLGALMQWDPNLKDIPSIYTNHTVVQAGLPTYGEHDTASLGRMLEIMAGGYQIKKDNFSFSIKNDMGHKFIDKMSELFLHAGRVDLSLAAVDLADATNGVSSEHALVTKELFRTAKKIIGVLNGSSNYFKNSRLVDLEQSKGKENITGEDLWDIQQNDGKVQFFKEIEARTGIKLDPNKQVLSLIRRISNYKSQYPILKDIIQVLCADRGTIVRTRWGDLEGLGQQVVVGGFAYTRSGEEKWVEAFLSWMNDPDLKGRFVFIPDSDVELLKLQAIGSDICINCPLPFEEACGTSDQRNAENGGLNVVIYDSGGGKEYMQQVDMQKRTGSGWMVGMPDKDGKLVFPSSARFYDKAPKLIYDALFQASKIYYEDVSFWKTLMLNAYHASEKVSAEAMAKRYVEKTFGIASEIATMRTEQPKISDQAFSAFINSGLDTLSLLEKSI
jgi:glucan phosphorylase